MREAIEAQLQDSQGPVELDPQLVDDIMSNAAAGPGAIQDSMLGSVDGDQLEEDPLQVFHAACNAFLSSHVACMHDIQPQCCASMCLSAQRPCPIPDIYCILATLAFIGNRKACTLVSYSSVLYSSVERNCNCRFKHSHVHPVCAVMRRVIYCTMQRIKDIQIAVK